MTTSVSPSTPQNLLDLPLDTLKSMVGYRINDELHQLADGTVVHELPLPSAIKRGVKCFIRRDDLIDPYESGNKRFKLHYNLLYAQAMGINRVASYGGAWSNHLYALAAAGSRLGLSTYAIIRGERPATLSAMLMDIEAMGVRLHFIDRNAYAAKELPAQLRCVVETEPLLLIPEGGNNALGALGMSAVGRSIANFYPDADVCLPVGTGASLAGVAYGLNPDQRAIGFSILKGEGGLAKDIARRLSELSSDSAAIHGRWSLITGFHCGGYGRKLPPYLKGFMLECEQQWPDVQWDPVYTIKMLWGVNTLLEQGYWRRGQTIVLVHTGGLQGRRGFGL